MTYEPCFSVQRFVVLIVVFRPCPQILTTSWVVVQLDNYYCLGISVTMFQLQYYFESKRSLFPVCVTLFQVVLSQGKRWIFADTRKKKKKLQAAASNQSNLWEVFANQLGNTHIFPQQQVVARWSQTGL